MDRPLDPLALEAQVCFALSAASRAMVALYRPILEPLGLTHPQYLVMLGLWQDARAGRSTTVSGLASRLYLDPGTLSPLLKRLEQQGLVERRRAAADARVVELHLTDAGAALREEALAVPARVVEATGLSLEQLERVKLASDAVIAAAYGLPEDGDGPEDADDDTGEEEQGGTADGTAAVAVAALP
ncbi:MarR family winged helix-turn-helix transcriptional regulator [Isoptericola variabilis]|uniref:Transcriptional regulator, MarR family n=1 Tax=Isoptericola variabilis (strain 225) TaxID=743718 RepID=F6FU23_ISOV2|nr:MarR family transcriptional regulator [Isoptericola variabilis]AEG43219.1 transcriptional regulator, MarR family [Isoptericola variabilis 225]TWH35154.1 DNA-binding MarR family transcriptional regulator [Isoptericola variabilis J7]